MTRSDFNNLPKDGCTGEKFGKSDKHLWYSYSDKPGAVCCRCDKEVGTKK